MPLGFPVIYLYICHYAKRKPNWFPTNLCGLHEYNKFRKVGKKMKKRIKKLKNIITKKEKEKKNVNYENVI